MAIVKMKKLRVMAMADRREALLRALLRLGCVEISEPDGLLEDPAWVRTAARGFSRLADTKTEINGVNIALEAIRHYAGLKDGLFIKRHPISERSSSAPDGRAGQSSQPGNRRTAADPYPSPE